MQPCFAIEVLSRKPQVLLYLFGDHTRFTKSFIVCLPNSFFALIMCFRFSEARKSATPLGSFNQLCFFARIVSFIGFIFLSTVAGYVGGSGVSARLASRYDSQQTMLLGALLCLLTTIIMWTGATLLTNNIWILMLPMTIYAVGMGLVLPHAMAIALAPFPHIAGTASALLGFIQMGLSAIGTAAVGAMLKDSPQPMLAAMFVINLAAVILSLKAYRQYRSQLT